MRPLGVCLEYMNKRLKILLGLLVIAIIIAAVYVLAIGPSMSVSTDMSTTTPETSTSTVPNGKTNAAVSTTKKPSTGAVQTPGTAGTPPVILWTFRDKSNPRDTSQLFTAVLLTENSNQYDLGTQIGICKTVADADLKGSGEISAIQCLVAGKGEEIGVFKQGSGYVVKSGKIELGKEGNPDIRGTFTVIQTLK